MAQNRDAPAFQEYAASMMARIDYRVLSLEARGLLYSLRLECWVNGEMPADPATLARALGYPQDEVARALEGLRPFFETRGACLRCPELDDYRAHLDERRQKQSAGGRKGAEKTNEARQGPPPATPSATPRDGRGSLVKPSPVKHSPAQQNPSSLDEGAVDAEWVKDYDATR